MTRCFWFSRCGYETTGTDRQMVDALNKHYDDAHDVEIRRAA